MQGVRATEYLFWYSSLSPVDGSSVLALLLLKVHRDAGHGRWTGPWSRLLS